MSHTARNIGLPYPSLLVRSLVHRLTRTLTRPGVVLDPFQQLLLRQVAEFSHDAPLVLQVGHPLYSHERQQTKDQQLLPVLLSNPAEELKENTMNTARGRETQEPPEL